MTILLTGGGTGGHIMPLLAVARELKLAQPEAKLVYVGERAGQFKYVTANQDDLDYSRYIFAGKFRRYHDDNWLKKFLDIKTNLLNIRDALFVFAGFWQALGLLLRTRPDAIFVKGGFVGVPIGLAAILCRVPYVTHDSDIVPGLANRIISRWARFNATGMPAEFYKYPKSKIRFTGIPVSHNFNLVSSQDQLKAKQELGIPSEAQIILITGGSQGSRRINTIAKQIIPQLLDKRGDCTVIHHVGKGNEGLYAGYSHPRLRVESFIEKFYMASAAADVVVARASATTIAELGVQAKPAIIIPSPFLAGGHQMKNAEYLAGQSAVLVLSETELLQAPKRLLETLERLLDNEGEREKLSQNLCRLSQPAAAKELAALLLETAKQ